MRKLVLSVVLLLLCNHTNAQIVYPGTNLPADSPRLFAEGIITDGLNNRDLAISPAGDELFFTLQQSRLSSTIIMLKKTNGSWGNPQVAPFSGRYRDLEAAFSPDGQTVFFASDRPVNNSAKKDFDLWKVGRLASGEWGQPVHLGAEVNTAKNEFYPSVAKNGSLYFTVEAAYGKGKEDIVVCTAKPNGYNAPVSLPEAINSTNYEFNAFVDPDEQYILFTGYGRADDMGGGDLYISRKDKAGNWQPAKHLPVNSAAIDYCPFVTPDKQYLVFTSARINKQIADNSTKTYEVLKRLLSGAGNGSDDLYWVNFNKDW
ncbi:MAG: hypothetical protein ABIN95_04470 [Mucilaginibacter sp.]